MLLVAVSVAATVAAMATSIKTAHASRGCVAAEMRRAMLAAVAAAAMLLVLLLFLVLVMLVIQDVRTYRTCNEASDRAKGTATKFVTNEGSSSTTKEC